METLYTICTGQAAGRYQLQIEIFTGKIDLGIWGDLFDEFLGQADVVSDFVYFASIVNDKDVNTAEKVFYCIFSCIGALVQCLLVPTYRSHHGRIYDAKVSEMQFKAMVEAFNAKASRMDLFAS